jgi:hypothetical protein
MSRLTIVKATCLFHAWLLAIIAKYQDEETSVVRHGSEHRLQARQQRIRLLLAEEAGINIGGSKTGQ